MADMTNMPTITPDVEGEDEHDFKLEEGSWAWIKTSGGLTLLVADRGDYVEVSSYETGSEFYANHTVCFDK